MTLVKTQSYKFNHKYLTSLTLDSVNMNTGNGRRRRRSARDLLDFGKLEETLYDLHWKYSNMVRSMEYLLYFNGHLDKNGYQ